MHGEQEQDAQERLDARIAKAQGAGMLAFDLEGFLHLLKNLGAHLRVVTDFLDLQHPAIGCKADLPQPSRSFNRRPTWKSYVLLMVVSVRKRAPPYGTV